MLEMLRRNQWIQWVVIITVVTKLLFLGAWSYQGTVPPIPAKEEVAAFLERQGFVVGHPDDEPELQLLRATKNGCSAMIAFAMPQGWTEDAIRNMAHPGETVSFAFRGELYPRQPTLQTWISYYSRWLLRFCGINLPSQTILGIVASADCDISAIPWKEVATVR